jgi:hypothetical protein
MLKLTLIATSTSITVQDPKAVTQNNEERAVINVVAGTSKSIDMQWQQLERISKQLNQLAAMGKCAFSIEPSDGPLFAEQADTAKKPRIDTVVGKTTPLGGAITLMGYNLTGGQFSAVCSLLGTTAAGSISSRAVYPGFSGNNYGIVVINEGVGGLAITDTVVDGKTIITVNQGDSASDCDTVATTLNTTYEGQLEFGVIGVGGTVVAEQELQYYAGGKGTGLSITLAGNPCVVTTYDDSLGPYLETITVNTPDITAIATAGDTAKFVLRSDSKEDSYVVTLSGVSAGNYVTVDRVDGAIAAAGSSTPDIVGTNLMNGQIQASAVLVSDGDGVITCTAIMPGEPGNLIDIAVEDTGGGGLTAGVVPVAGKNVITIDLGGATPDCTAVAAVLDGTPAIAALITTAVTGTAADEIVVQDAHAFAGGVGSGITVLTGEVEAIITAIDLTSTPTETITVETAAVGTAGDAINVTVISNNQAIPGVTVILS